MLQTAEFDQSQFEIGIANDIFALKKAIYIDDYKEAEKILKSLDRNIQLLNNSGRKLSNELATRYDRVCKKAYEAKICVA